jgi:hypothetical protein
MLRDDDDGEIGQPMIDYVRKTYRGRMRLGDGDFDADACAIVQICDELDRTRRRQWHRENELRAALLGIVRASQRDGAKDWLDLGLVDGPADDLTARHIAELCEAIGEAGELLQRLQRQEVGNA